MLEPLETITCISSPKAMQTHGHYAQGVKCGRLLFVSGILGNCIDHPPNEAPSIEEQTINCLTQIESIVAAAGGDRSRIVKTTVFVLNLADWPKVNGIYAQFFGDHRPARIVVPCGPMRLAR